MNGILFFTFFFGTRNFFLYPYLLIIPRGILRTRQKNLNFNNLIFEHSELIGALSDGIKICFRSSGIMITHIDYAFIMPGSYQVLIVYPSNSVADHQIVARAKLTDLIRMRTLIYFYLLRSFCIFN